MRRTHSPLHRILTPILCTCLLAGCSSSAPLSQTESAETETASYDYEYTGSFDYSRAMAQRNQVFDAEHCALNAVADSFSKKKQDYTVMIYMIGSNLESKMGNATKDLLEIRSSGLDYTENNVLVYTGGSQRWMGKVPCDRNCVFDLARPEDQQIVAETDGNADMGAPESLSAFLNFAYENYPSEHYALILWDHGGGPLWGYGSDELFSSDSLLLSEMQKAMDATPFSKKKLDWVGFDACLMGSLECMTLWSQYADYYVGSEELEPGDGWDYSFLKVLNDSTDPEVITSQIVDSYGKYYQSIRSEYYDPDVTLSAVNLKKLPEVIRQMAALSDDMIDEIQFQEGYSAIQKVRSDTKSFGLVEGAKGEEPYSYDLIDLSDFAANMGDRFPSHRDNLKAAVEDLVVSSYSNVDDACGVTFYYPFRNKGQYSEMADVYADVAGSTSYRNFLSNLAKEWMNTRARDWNLGDLTLDPSANEYTLQLTEDQRKNSTAAYYSILSPKTSYSYYPVLQHCRVEPDEKGILHIPANPEVIYLTTDTENGGSWPMVELENSDSRQVYQTINTRLIQEPNFVYYLTSYNSELQDISVVLQQTPDDSLQIQNVTANDITSSFGGKNTINISHYDSLYYYFRDYIPTRDAENRLLPFSEWEPTGSSNLHSVTLSNQFGYAKKPCNELLENAVIQLELEDSNGEIYASNLAAVSANEKESQVTVSTPNGKMSFLVDDTRAIVTGYTGADAELTIPDQVEGRPVTIIGANAFEHDPNIEELTIPEGVTAIETAAFHNCRSLRLIHLPSTLKKICSESFNGCPLEEVSIPAGVTHIGKEAFENCTSLQSIDLPDTLLSIDEGILKGTSSLLSITMNGQPNGTSRGCQLIDGVIFSKDRKVLIAGPAGRSGSYQVPEGTVKIGFGAFTEASLNTITFPESLRIIGNSAFRGCSNLEVPRFPAHLQEIGLQAFGDKMFQLCFNQREGKVQTITIGPDVNFIGAGAFDGFQFRRFEVDPENPYYSAVDGALCNGEGDALLSFTMDSDPVLTVPQGVLTFDFDLLKFVSSVNTFDVSANHLQNKIHVILPKSASKFQNLDTSTSSLNNIQFHVENGSVAEQYFKEYNQQVLQEDPNANAESLVQYDSNTDLHYHQSKHPTAYGEMFFYIYTDHAELITYEGTDARLEVPASIEGVPVTVLGDGINELQRDLPEDDQVQIPEGSTDQHNGLLQLILPDSLEIIRSSAFSWSSTLEDLELPDSLRILENNSVGAYLPFHKLPASLESIGDNALSGRGNEELVIPASLRDIAPKAFDSLNGITSFRVEAGNPNFKTDSTGTLLLNAEGTTVLGSCPTITAAVIPDGVTRIENYAFHGDMSLTHVELPDTLTEIGTNAFSSCFELAEIHLPDNVSQIEHSAFYGCDKLTEIRIPGSCRVLGDHSFSSCGGLRTVTLSEGLEEIGSGAFSYCPKLGQISLPASLRVAGYDIFGESQDEPHTEIIEELHIGKYLTDLNSTAFSGLKVKKYTVDPDNPKFCALEGMITNKNMSKIIAIPGGVDGTFTIPEGLLLMEYSAFPANSLITDIVIPDSIKQLTSFGERWIYDSETYESHREYTVTIHCHKDSYAEEFAREQEMPYVIY